jgi:hypothetical protein
MRPLATLALLLPACTAADPPGLPDDLLFSFPGHDLAANGAPHRFQLGPGYSAPVPLPTDQPPDPNQSSDGVLRDASGYLVYRPTHAFDHAWIANAIDWGRGTVSKIDTHATREVARYLTVACSPCGGKIGCCSNDDPARFDARLQHQPEPPPQPIQLTDNLPSRTSVDFDGTLWIENRAPAGQASITRIANDFADCVDRNANGTIDTSGDLSGDGLIQTDCNRDGRPDDLASVRANPCLGGSPQEFFGLDDECLLFTVHIGAREAEGRALALGPGAQGFGPSDPWAGTTADATLYRVDGATGIIKDRGTLPIDCQPDGLVVDAVAIAWTSARGKGPLCWLDTRDPAQSARVRSPLTGAVDGRTLVLDRDQNLWLADRTAAAALRYTPDRSAGLAKLGAGYWTRLTSAGMAAGAPGHGVAIAVDSRTANLYFAWLTLDWGWLVRLPASTLPVPKMADQEIDAALEPALPLPGFDPIAVGVARDQTIQVVSRSPSGWLAVPADEQGTMTAPDLQSPAKPPNLCPAGASCLLRENLASEPGSDAHTDFIGRGLATDLVRPRGYYTYIVPGCEAGTPTRWRAIAWDSEVPLNTALTVRARTGPTPQPDATWGPWTTDFPLSPVDLLAGQPLLRNDLPSANYLQLEVDLTTTQKNATPRLKSLQVTWECRGS